MDLTFKVQKLETEVEESRKAFSMLEDAGLPFDLQCKLLDFINKKQIELIRAQNQLETQES